MPAQAPLLLASALLIASVLPACGTSMYVRPDTKPYCEQCVASAGDLDSRLVLIGDAGEDIPDSPNLAQLKRLAAQDPSRTLVLFLGDNIYPSGMPAEAEGDAEQRATAERIMRYQASAVAAAGGSAIFVPGNHDWARSGEDGMQRILAQQAWLDEHSGSSEIRVLPRDACPGPVVVDRGERVRVVVLDTEWLLTPEDRARGAADCVRGSEQGGESYDPAANSDVYEAIGQIISETPNRNLVLATHHPLETRGEHGAYAPLQYWLFPLTRLVSWLYVPVPLIYPPLRFGIVRSDQDMVGRRNREMVGELRALIDRVTRAPVVVASGHDHNLQVFENGGGSYQIVSGSGSKREPVGKNQKTLFRHAHVGLVVLDYFVDGRVALRVYEPAKGRDDLVFSTWLERH